MHQHQSRASHLFVAACGLMAALSLGSFAVGQDVTISDATPALNFVQTPASYSWRISADSESFDISDQTANTDIFRIAVAAPDFSFCIGSDGRIGMGTNTPQADLHVSTGEVITALRLQSLGPYAWDLEGSGGEFNIVDATFGSLPFGIQSSAPTNSFYVSSSGNVGYGTAAPLASVHIKKPALASTAELMARFETTDDTVGALSFVNASATNGNFIPKIQGRAKGAAVSLIQEGLVVTDSGNDPAIAFNAQKSTGGALVTRPLAIFRNNNANKVIIGANGIVTATSFNSVSSRELKDKIRELDSEKASSALRQLTPVEFVYKDDPAAEPKVGFIAEDVPDIVAEPDRKSVPVMDVVALLTKVVKDQDRLIDEQKKTNDRQQKTIDELMKRLEALEGKSRD